MGRDNSNDTGQRKSKKGKGGATSSSHSSAGSSGKKEPPRYAIAVHQKSIAGDKRNKYIHPPLATDKWMMSDIQKESGDALQWFTFSTMSEYYPIHVIDLNNPAVTSKVPFKLQMTVSCDNYISPEAFVRLVPIKLEPPLPFFLSFFLFSFLS
jgi:hypothetical protein